MSLTEGSGASSSPESAALGEVLTFFGSGCRLCCGLSRPKTASASRRLPSPWRRSRTCRKRTATRCILQRVCATSAPSATPRSQRRTASGARGVRWHAGTSRRDGARLCERIAALPNGDGRYRALASRMLGRHRLSRSTALGRHSARPRNCCTSRKRYRAPAAIRKKRSRRSPSKAAARFAPEASAHVHHVVSHVRRRNRIAGDRRIDALDDRAHDAAEIIERARRAGRRTQRYAAARRAHRAPSRRNRQRLRFDAENRCAQMRLASLLFGIGELRAAQLETHAVRSARAPGHRNARRKRRARRQTHRTAARRLRDVAPIVRARGEWYDGTGRPDGLRHDAIPQRAHVAGSRDCLRCYRRSVSQPHHRGTHAADGRGSKRRPARSSIPAVVRALTDVVKARA